MLVNGVVMPLQVMITSTSTKFQCVFVCWVAWYPFASLLPWFRFFACLLFARVISCCSGFCILHFDWLVVWLRVWLLVCLFVCLLACLPVSLSACLPPWPAVCLCVCLSVCFVVDLYLFVRSFVCWACWWAASFLAWLIVLFFACLLFCLAAWFLVTSGYHILSVQDVVGLSVILSVLRPAACAKVKGCVESPLRLFGHSMAWEIMIAAFDQGRVQVLHNEPRQN